MPHPWKIALHCRRGYDRCLDRLVEAFIRDGVSLVAVVGKDCKRVADIIDELVVGDGGRAANMLSADSRRDR